MLLGFGIAGYRSFGKDIQRVGPLGKLNFIAGPNNSGKSNVLRFLVEHQHSVAECIRRRKSFSFGGLDLHEGLTNDDVKYSIAVGISASAISTIAGDLSKAEQYVSAILHHLKSPDTPEVVWIDLHRDKAGNFQPAPSFVAQFRGTRDPPLDRDQLYRFWSIVTSRSGGDLNAHWLPESLAWLVSRALPPTPKAKMIPALRQITSAGEIETLNGTGLIPRLAQLQHPSIDKLNDKQRFAGIEAFVQEVTRCGDAKLEIPSAHDTIHVNLHGRILPLSHLGTGIEQLVLLAALSTLEENQILCIEEPEIHFHPLYQRELARYWATKTSNQYVIATHSAHFLNDPEANVLRIRNEGRHSEISIAKSPRQKLDVFADLGYRASDLLQCNAIIWVEGPSDRVYLLHWLAVVAPHLIEGLHFSIMFYGGRLLSHLSATDSEVQEFISLRRLNQNMAILIDSDKRKSTDRINATKERVSMEISTHGGYCWITAGRQIENYLPNDTFVRAVSTVHPSATVRRSFNRYGIPVAGGVYLDKLSIAHAACEGTAALGVLDLEEKVAELATFIEAANQGDLRVLEQETGKSGTTE